MTPTDIDLLKGIPLFAKLSEAERAHLASLLKTQTFEPNHPVFWIGDEGTDFYIIQHGRVILCFPDEAGNETELAVLGPGAFFGEISLLDGGPRTASARAKTPLILLCLSRAEFLAFLAHQPAAAIHILTVLGHRTRGMLDKLRGVKNVNEMVDENATTWHRVADRVTALMVSPAFVLTQLTLIGAWIVISEIERHLLGHTFDVYPYCLLALVVSGEALFLSVFVLISQNRQSTRDRIRADLDYQVNLKAHLEVMQLHQKVDRISAAVVEISSERKETPRGDAAQSLADQVGPAKTDMGETINAVDPSKLRMVR